MIPFPNQLQLIGSEFAIAWSDSKESYFNLETLRRACPCATCSGEPDVTGKIVKPRVTYTDQSFICKGYQVVGGYALQPFWGDGHQTGLYSWKYLRALDPQLHDSN
ncbi:MAG: DUF971 domain-containing protein [Verrucomicrobiae bacterium]|nr:DUF971 domain-containing protein [Verrucomicrobiae bacterium]